MLYLSRKHYTVDLADNGGWDIEVLDTPGIHRQQGRLPPAPAATLPRRAPSQTSGRSAGGPSLQC